MGLPPASVITVVVVVDWESRADDTGGPSQNQPSRGGIRVAVALP